MDYAERKEKKRPLNTWLAMIEIPEPIACKNVAAALCGNWLR